MSVRSIIALCLGFMLTSAALAGDVPEKLDWQDLVNRPDRWPPSVTLKKDFNFGGEAAKKGQKVVVLQYAGGEIGVDAGNNLFFEIGPDDSDFLDAANKVWAELTPAQRAVDPQTLAADPSLWPAKVAIVTEMRLDNGKPIKPGSEFDLLSVSPDGAVVWLTDPPTKLTVDLGSIDVIARARELAKTDPEKRPSRIANALRDQMIDSTGKPFKIEKLDDARIFALYYSASWCGPCRQFSPGFIKYINENSAKNPNQVVVMMSNDEKDDALVKYMQEMKMPWPAVPLAKLNKTPALLGYAGTGIPQLVVVDRNGTVLANSFENGRNVGPQRAMQTLTKLLDEGAAK